FADHRPWRHYLNRLQIWRASDDLARVTSRLFEQDLESAAMTLPIERGLLSVDCRLEAVEPLGFHRVGDLTRQVRGRRSRTRRGFEWEGDGVTDFIHQRQRRANVLRTLVREAHDEVGRERNSWLRV